MNRLRIKAFMLADIMHISWHTIFSGARFTPRGRFLMRGLIEANVAPALRRERNAQHWLAAAQAGSNTPPLLMTIDSIFSPRARWTRFVVEARPKHYDFYDAGFFDCDTCYYLSIYFSAVLSFSLAQFHAEQFKSKYKMTCRAEHFYVFTIGRPF